MNPSASDSTPASAGFHTTRWTCVLAARGESDTARAALSELCEAYYEPVHTFIRHMVGADSARDLTHAFFASLLERDGLATIKRGRGKFRSYLLGAVKHFIFDQRDRSRAEKRGGGAGDLSSDEEKPDSPGVLKWELKEPPPPDSLYDREWAIAVLRRANDCLENEHRASDRMQQFEVLKPWLNGDAGTLSQSTAAAELGVSENVIRVAVHRLRKRFREAVRDEIGQTVETEEEISNELNYLIEALHGRS